MKIKQVSDLHLEFSDYIVENNENCDVLILGGDIMVAEKVLKPESEYGVRFRNFLKHCSEAFPHVIYIAGNHELYGGYWFKSLDRLREACGVHNNLHFLENESIKFDDVTFIGGTLWTDMNKADPLTLHAVRDMMMDYKAINNDRAGFTNLKPADTVHRHRATLDYIKSIVAERGDEKFVVCTHHTPSFQSCHEQYKTEYLMNGAYHSELSEFILDRPQIKLWTHGHTHNSFDYMIGETRVVCNPRGYHSHRFSEDTEWNPDIVLEV